MSQIIKNDGVNVRFPDSANGNFLQLQSGDEVYKIQVCLGMHGTNVVRLTSDFRIQVSGFTLSEPQNRDFIVAVLEELGFIFEEDDPRSRIEPLRDERGDLRRGWKNVLAMAGYPDPSDSMTEGYETTPDGLVYAICNRQRHPSIAPVLALEVRREAAILIATANRWLHANLRSFKRSVKLTPFEVVQLYMRAKNENVSVIEVDPSESVDTRYWDPPSFGSGGGWSVWTVYGLVTKGESSDRAVTVTFDKGPAVVFTAAGDSINGGRTFYRKMYVVKPTGELKTRSVRATK